ncbi:hybrid sensor histidine kinase/response regulator transcription factor [Pedobacter alpinus]|uniref:histidine kinase n=1 Tax=Pedobacter alpinus TaxID=1590643 RepID=A0ABW5TWV5_9SPHI
MSVKQLRLYLVATFFIFTAIEVKAQDRSLNFLNISSREGLSSNSVSAMLKDEYGFMWFATDDGLNKFDGQHFTIYRHIATDPKSLSSNEVIDLYEDQKGTLWVVTAASLMSYDRNTDSFIDYSAEHKTGIISVSSDKEGRIWIAAYDGISILNTKTNRLEPIRIKNNLTKKILTNPLIKIFRDKLDRMWICSTEGLFQYFYKEGTVIRFSEFKNLTDYTVNNIYEDEKSNLWLATNNGLTMLRSDGKGSDKYKFDPNNKNTLNSNIVYTIAGDKNGEIWVGTEEGLNIVDPVTKTVRRVERGSRNNYSLRGKAVKSILIDKQGIYWVASYRSGVSKYDKNLAFFNLVSSNRYDPLGLNAPVVTSFIQADQNSVYVGTDGGGLSLFDIPTRIFRRIPLSSTKDAKFSILAMEKVGSEIWIGTYLEGLFIYNTKTGASKQIRSNAGPQSLNDNNIFCIKKDSRGNVWVGTNGKGVNCYDLTTNKVEYFNNSATGKYKININGYIRSLEEDSKGNMWIGTSGSGIAVYNPVTGKTKMLSKGSGELSNDNVITINCAKDGMVYIGSIGGGLTVYDHRANKFTTYSEQNGLANSIVYKILEDNSGKIWLSTNRGISSFDTETKKFRNYFYHNGVQRSPFVLGAGLKLSDGRLFFGGTDGFNYFNPALLYGNKNVPLVVLTDLKIANQSIKPSEDGELKAEISVAKEINLDYKQNFSLSYVALNYTSPQENRYFYKLDNFDKDWNSVGNSNTAVYTNLDPGEYTFRVRASSDSGGWSSKETTIKIYVKPPFWLTYYAYILYFLIVVGTLFVIRYLGIQKLKAKFLVEQERNKAQQLIEEERREADRQHEFDQLKINFLTNISHEFRTPISLIMGPVDQLLQEEASSEKSGQLKMVRRNAKRLLNLVNQLLDFRNIKQKEQKLNATDGDFISFAKDVADSFKDLADRKRINFNFKSSLMVYSTSFDHEKLERILFNLLSNAFKFTLPEGDVLLSIDENEDKNGIKIILKDTGIGMDESVTAHIFERFFQDDSKTEILNQGSGIGLAITKEFVRLHGGSIEVESVTGKGSAFTISLPLIKQENEVLVQEADVNSYSEVSPEDIKVEQTKNEDNFDKNLNQPVILLVEDNEDFRIYLKDNLKKSYKIVEATDGKDGWQKVLSSHPDLVVSDISMPFVSGTELCEKIKSDKRTNHIPVLLLTALTAEEDQLMGLNKGANDYMSKPFNLEILNAKIRNLLTLNESLKTTYSKRIKVDTPEIEIELESEKLLNKVIQYVETNLTNSQLSVEELSRHLGMSRGSLYTKILEFTGESPVNYIRSIKLDKAIVLLEKSELNISQISYAVGFAAPNYFARAFKGKFNMLPSEYMVFKRNSKSADKNQKEI